MNFTSLIKKGLLVGLGVFFISLVISFIGGEFIVKHVFPQDTYSLSKSVGLYIFSSERESIPFTLKPNIKNFHHIGYTHEFDHFISTNSWGIRGKDFKKEKESGIFRILFLGDSMPFGWGVEDDQNYPYLLENLLNESYKSEGKKFEIINASFTGGKTLDSYYIYLKEIGLDFNPDLIILTLFPYNDVHDLTESDWEKSDAQGYPIKITSLVEKVDNGYRVKRKKTNWKYEIPLLRNSHLMMLFFGALEKGSPQTVAKIKKILKIEEDKDIVSREMVLKCLYSLQEKDCPKEVYPYLEKSKFLLDGINKLTLEKEKKLLVTILATQDQLLYLKEKGIKPEEAQPQKYFTDFLKEKQIALFDLLPSLLNTNDQELYYTRDGHFNRKGHKFTARTLFTFLHDNYLKN